MKRYLIYPLIFCLLPGILQGQVTESDSLALVAIYKSTNGDSWTDNTNWLQPGQQVASWYGIEVQDSFVEHIYLDQNNLTGALPEEIGDLNRLKVLDLKMNQIAGEIPPAIGKLKDLEVLSLRSNQLTGSIPTEIGNLINLEHLYLFENQLDGSIPPEIGNLTRLDYLLLQNNNLTGSIPVELGYLTNLTVLRLNYNLLTDSIPEGIGNLTKLTDLHLSNNELIGNIPVQIGNLNQLNQLNLSENKLSGSIPREIGNLEELTWFALHRNQISDSIPSELGNLIQLTYLSLHNNELSGAIPPEIGKLNNLQFLFLRGNQLTSLPAQIGNLKNLKSLSVRFNSLQGDLPKEIGNLDSLEVLSLEYNQLSGTIPAEIGQLKKLTNLLLQFNQIEGSIPVEVGNLTNLESINLSNNRLEGPVPHEIKDLPLLSNLQLQQNRFNFHDLEPLIGNAIGTLYYSPQAILPLTSTQVNRSTGDDLNVDITNHTVNQCIASKNKYQWWKDGLYITGYSDSPVLSLTEMDQTDAGDYSCTMINADFPDLTLVTDALHLVVDGPVDLILSSDTVAENVPAGTFVGILTTSDPDQTDGHTYALSGMDGIVDADNEFFTLNQDSLFIKLSPDFETKNEYRIHLTVTDHDAKTFSKAFVIYIDDIQEPATAVAAWPSAHLKVYPNPVKDYIRIELESPAKGPVCAELLDINGRLVQSRKFGASQTGGTREFIWSIDPALPPGSYFVTLSFDNLKRTMKLIKD